MTAARSLFRPFAALAVAAIAAVLCVPSVAGASDTDTLAWSPCQKVTAIAPSLQYGSIIYTDTAAVNGNLSLTVYARSSAGVTVKATVDGAAWKLASRTATTKSWRAYWNDPVVGGVRYVTYRVEASYIDISPWVNERQVVDGMAWVAYAPTYNTVCH